MKNIIFDLDGTLANIDHRKKFITGELGYKSYTKFFSPVEVFKDTPIHSVMNILRLYKDAGYKIFIFTGRDEISRSMTISWLNQYDIKYDVLLMRPTNSHTPDTILKKTWLLETFDNPQVEVEAVYDDRDSVVAMWRRMGLRTLQVAPGNF
jgi:FMN phosphatase YigB (HAD superfamily)